MNKSGKIVLVGLGIAVALGCFIGGSIIGEKHSSVGYSISIQEQEDRFNDLLQQKDDEIFQLKKELAEFKGFNTLKESDIDCSNISGFTAERVWSDGENTYYSHNTDHYVLNGKAWERKTWNGLEKMTAFRSKFIWHYKGKTYYSNQSTYMLDGDTWKPVIVKGERLYFYGDHIWIDGENIYDTTFNDVIRILIGGNGDFSTEPVTFNNLPMDGFGGKINSISSSDVWNDGVSTHYSSQAEQYVLNGDTWEKEIWKGFAPLQASCVWAASGVQYYSRNSNQYILIGDTWEEKSWTGQASFTGFEVWTDGTNYYAYTGGQNYIFSHE